MENEYEAILRTAPGSIDAGVDYLTITAADENSRLHLDAITARLQRLRAEQGHTHREGAFKGYSTRTAAGITFGERADGCIVRLTGGDAREHWHQLAPFADNVTRLDLQVTGTFDQPEPRMAETAYHHALALPPGVRQPRRKTFVQNESGGATFYLGSRESEHFLRLYDWGVKHGEAEPGLMWRWEAEIKGDASGPFCTALLAHTQRQLACAGMVHSVFSDRRVPLGWSAAKVEVKSYTPRVTDDDRSLQWLASQVKPTVARLRDKGRLEEALEALGLLDDFLSNTNQ